MKRRTVLKSLAAAPAAAAALPAQIPAPAAARTDSETPKLTTVTPDAAGGSVRRFFSPEQFAALQKLSSLLMPSVNGLPDAGQADAAGFLDFLIGKSPEGKRQLYRAGLDRLNEQARTRYSKPFGDLSAVEAAPLLISLTEPWTYDPPADPLKHFLREAKEDVYSATVNSREFVVARSAGRRSSGGTGVYWHVID